LLDERVLRRGRRFDELLLDGDVVLVRLFIALHLGRLVRRQQ
jgi:hypothetical protein